MNIIPISSNPLIPLSATYTYDGSITLKPEYHIHTDSGYYGITNPLFSQIKDVKVINNSLFFISSAVSLGTVIEDTETNVDTTDMVIFTSLKTKNNTYFKTESTYVLGTESNSDNRSLFNFNKLSDGTYNIIDSTGKYWTIELESPWSISLENKLVVDTNNQQTFILEYVDNYVYIKTNFKNIYYPPIEPSYYKRFIGIDTITGRIGANGFIVNDKTDFRYEMVDFNSDSFTLGYEPDSIYVKYYNELETPRNNKTLEFKTSITNTKNNLLIDSPFKTSINTETGTILVNMATLKNIQTPEYEYTKAPYFVNETITNVNSANAVDAIKRREYNQLFMGSNQERGYENPCLGFNADTKELTFKADTVTYFHYPKTAPTGTPIQNVGFLESGAVPGNTPARSDKIWKKFADYEKNIWWGNSTHAGVSPTSSVYMPIEQGTWLCSWLSGKNAEGVDGVWMDRWYYPGFATVSDALTLDTMFLENTGAKVWDEPTQMTLDGGCWYKYFHVGNIENQKLVDALANEGLTGLRISFDGWETNVVEDESIYNNDGLIHNFTSDTIVDGSFKPNKTQNQYCLVPYSPTYKLSDKLTVTTRVKIPDWSNVHGHHIISNGINNGWNIQATNGYFTPSIIVFEKTYGHLIFINNDGDMYYDALYPVSSHSVSGDFYGVPTALAMDGDLTIWATNNDPNMKRLYRASYNGILNEQVVFDSDVNLTEVSIDANKNAWVLNTTTNTASGFSPDLSLIGTIQMTSVSSVQRIDFDTNNVFLSGDYTILDRCIDANNNIFELRLGSQYLYKNGVAVYNADGVTNIECDSNGILWLLKDGNIIVKTTSNSTEDDKSGVVGQYTSGQRRLFFTNEYYNDAYRDFAWVLHSETNKLFKVDEDCNVVQEINLSDYVDVLSSKFSGQDRSKMVFDINGDTTGYLWQTKYVNHIPRIEVHATLNQYLTAPLTLSYPASNLIDNEYYNISFTYDSDNSSGMLYVNTTLVDTYSASTDSSIYYKYDNLMLIGGDMGDSVSLNEHLFTDRYIIDGQIDELKIYDSVLNNFDIKHIELRNYNFSDMVWNMPVGIQSFIEEIERFFKQRLPGAKSHFYNIRLSHLNITNIETREIIEQIIRDTVKRVSPVYTSLYKIIWD